MRIGNSTPLNAQILLLAVHNGQLTLAPLIVPRFCRFEHDIDPQDSLYFFFMRSETMAIGFSLCGLHWPVCLLVRLH